MCRCLEVSRSSYYDWCHSSGAAHRIENEIISKQLKTIFAKSHNTYGTRRLKYTLAKAGYIVSRRRIARLMKMMDLRCKRKKRFRRTTDSKHQKAVSANILNRNFSVSQPDQYYVGDITYIPTQAGWLYLAVVIDLYSRKVVGWSMADNMRVKLVNDALMMAIWRRKPKPGLVWHTDRGVQYASERHREILQQHQIIQSMSRKGNCWDNAVAESFFHSLKTEVVHHIKFKTREEARRTIFEYIEVFYNPLRIHSTNNYLSPDEFELARFS